MVAVDQLQSNAGLSKVWLASHYENKITKSQLLNTDLNSAIEYLSNLESEEPIALRVSGQLLLGVVRIHSRKTKYLLEDCNGTLSKIKMVFKQGNVNMADTSRTKANVETITLAETLNDIDLLLPDPSAVLNDDGRDSMFDSATQDFSNSFFDISAEHGRLLDSEQDLDNLMNDIEMGRRDQDPALEQSFSADLDSPMNKLQINDQRNVDEDIGDFGELDFDFDLGDDLSQREQTPRPEFHLPAMDDNLDASLDTLMQDGIVPMADSNALMFGLDDDSSITQQQASSGRRRRHLAVDRVTEIPHDDLQSFMQDTSHIVRKDNNDEQPSVAQATHLDLDQSTVVLLGSNVNAMVKRWNQKRLQSFMDINEMQTDADLNALNPVTPRPDTNRFDELDYDFDIDDDSPMNDMPAAAATPGVPSHLLESDSLGELGGTYNSDIPNGQYEPLDFMTQQSTFGHHTTETNNSIQDKLQAHPVLQFTDLAPPATTTRTDAARLFFDVLVLASRNSVSVKQTEPYGPIEISA